MKIQLLLAMLFILPVSTHAEDIFADTVCKEAYEYYFLNRAIAHEDMIGITYLLDGGSDIDASGYRNFVDCGGYYEYSSPLMDSVYNQNTEIITLLLERGANPNIVQGEGETALDVAKEQNNQKIINLLLKYGAKTYAHIKK